MTSPEIYAIARSVGLAVVANHGLRPAGAPPLPVELEAGGVKVATFLPLDEKLVIGGFSQWTASARSEDAVLLQLAQGAVAALWQPKLSEEGRTALFAVIDRCIGRLPRLPVESP